MKNGLPFNTQSEKSLRVFAHAEFGLRIDSIRIKSASNSLHKAVKFVEVDSNRCIHTANSHEDAVSYMLDELNKRQSKERERQHEMNKRSQLVLDRASRIIMGAHTRAN